MYEGQFSKGKFNGQGVITLTDNTSIQANFERGRVIGSATYIAHDFEEIIGEAEANFILLEEEQLENN
jgi:hypothetical protein